MTQDAGRLPGRRVEDLPARDGGARRSTATATGSRSSSAPASSASASSPPTAASAATTAPGPASTRRATSGSAAAANPDVKFLVYHSGWQSGVAEDHPFNTADAAPLGVDRLIKTVARQRPRPERQPVCRARHDLVQPDEQHERSGARARQAAQVPRARSDPVGNRLLQQRRPAIPDPGVPRLPDPGIHADDVRLPGAHGRGEAQDLRAQRRGGLRRRRPDRCARKITQDDIANLSLARRAEPDAFPRGPRPHGPRTRREYLAFLRWSGEASLAPTLAPEAARHGVGQYVA